MNQGLAPCDAVLELQPGLPADIRDNAWEVGRLVLAPEYRAGPELLRHCLAMTLLHMFDHTSAQNFFACCKPVLARLYRRFGMSVLVKSAAGDPGQEPFSLIHGGVRSIADAICDDAASPPSVVLQ